MRATISLSGARSAPDATHVASAYLIVAIDADKPETLYSYGDGRKSDVMLCLISVLNSARRNLTDAEIARCVELSRDTELLGVTDLNAPRHPIT